MSLAELVRESLSKVTSSTGVFAVLHREHEEVAGIIDAIRATSEGEEDERSRLFAELRGALVPHAKGEEEVLYARLVQEEAVREQALEGTQEHQVVLRLVNELHAMTSRGDVWMAKFKVLSENIEHHVGEEEKEMFPRARGALSAAELNDLVPLYEAARDRHARELGA